MKKLGTFALIGAAAAGILTAGASVAAADDHVDVQSVVAPGEPDPTGGTGSSQLIKVLDQLATGSGRSGTAPN
ncbi:hypothetical protein D7D52_11245 [Nocardia yunnanensis]|uniref:Secreted protein n=1 Tax=Nocardia yunnanensis TaxID=2382165 RepID=A0A386ZB67_9NOCA|nr:hypothetical protein [Nocardia yunnanensis]AYF74344.1 hypothetical protein D7D52_11245 [Nocardia yunnanensis]